MCAPKNQIAQLALVAAAAYATGGASAVAGNTAREAAIIANTGAATSSGSVLATLGSFARASAPYIGAASSIYSGYLNSQMLQQKANFVDFKVGTEREAFALRKAKRTRDMLRKIGSQRALYGVSGVTIEGTPGDIIELTASNFREDQYIDAFNTSQKILGSQFSADQLRTESKVALLGGFVKAGTDIGVRGIDSLLTTETKPKTTGANA